MDSESLIEKKPRIKGFTQIFYNPKNPLIRGKICRN